MIRAYSPTDLSACLRVFDSNVPRYFSSGERDRFRSFLDDLPGPAWVTHSDEQQVTGFGAVSFVPNGHEAWLRWGMVDSRYHRQGIGEALLLTRLAWIRHHSSAVIVRVATTRSVGGFFEHMGFRLVAVTRGGMAPDLDRVDYALDVHKCLIT